MPADCRSGRTLGRSPAPNQGFCGWDFGYAQWLTWLPYRSGIVISTKCIIRKTFLLVERWCLTSPCTRKHDQRSRDHDSDEVGLENQMQRLRAITAEYGCEVEARSWAERDRLRETPHTTLLILTQRKSRRPVPRLPSVPVAVWAGDRPRVLPDRQSAGNGEPQKSFELRKTVVWNALQF